MQEKAKNKGRSFDTLAILKRKLSASLQDFRRSFLSPSFYVFENNSTDRSVAIAKEKRSQ